MYHTSAKCINNLPLIIFAHIEKTGGTSFNGVLRTYHGINYAHVRSLMRKAPPAERAVHLDDLTLYQRLVPWLNCVSGHAIRPWVLLDEGMKDKLFMTVLREPLARYVSYYTYGGGVNRKPWTFSFEEYLGKEEFHNFQTKRIAGVADADRAMSIINQNFLAASTLESMGELLDNLDKIWPGIKDCASLVGRRNVRSDPDRKILLESYYDKIVRNNGEDIKLYQMLQEHFQGLFLRSDIFTERPMSCVKQNSGGQLSEKISVLLRRTYLSPITGLVRVYHGLPYRGTY